MFGPAPDVRSAIWTGTAIRAKVGGLLAQSARQIASFPPPPPPATLAKWRQAAFPFLRSRFCVPVSAFPFLKERPVSGYIIRRPTRRK